ncbi:MAG TPA: YitT family protein, partial [Bacteroidales bacterium]|nr:YitT family protein [Bacteroidales bacterium]
TRIKPEIIITFGLFLNALGWTAFLIPAEITGGGSSGVATLIFYATGLPVGISFLIINVFLVIFAIKMLGARFGIKTIYAVVVLSVFLAVLQQAITEPIIKENFMSAVIGGILAGAGVGIVFTQGGSTGGTDIIAMIVNKYKNISPGRVILYLDVLIISSSYLLFHSIEKMVYGYVTMGVASYVIDMVLSGSKQSFQIFIFSREHEKIADRLGTEVGRGITILDGKGWYSKEPVKLLMIMVRKHESNHVFRIVKEVDNKAFISVGSIMGVYGEGFEHIRG